MAEVEASTVDGPGSPPLLAMIGQFDASNFELVADFLILWLAPGRPAAVVDMTRTRCVDAAIIGVLVASHTAGLTLTVRGVAGLVRVALDAAGAVAVLNVEAAPP